MFALGIAMIIVGSVLLLAVILYQLYALSVAYETLAEGYALLLEEVNGE